MKVTKELVKRFKDLDVKVKSGKASPAEMEEAKKLADIIRGNKGHGRKDGFKGKHPGTNDLDWYSKYAELIRDSANVIFNEIAGTKFECELNAPQNTCSLQWPTVGVRVEITPTIGKSIDPNDAFNYQMRDLWLKLHRAFRGVGTYEYADLGIVIYCIMHAFANLARAERIYGVLNMFNSRNRSLPKALLQALYVDPSYIDTIIGGNDIADFRYQLNRLIAKAKLLCLPKDLAIFKQMTTLFGNVFKDSDNVRAQWIVYDTPFLIEYDPTFTTGGRAVYKLRYVSAGNFGQTLPEIISDLNRQFDALLLDTDVARMCSDVLKAFGDNGIQTLESIPEAYETALIKDDIRTVQLHNSTLVGSPAGGRFSSAIWTAMGTITSTEQTLHVYQEGGIMKQSIFSAGNAASTNTVGTNVSFGIESGIAPGVYIPRIRFSDKAYMTGNPFLDTFKDDVTPGDVVEMTRQLVGIDYHATADSTFISSFELNGYSTYVVNGLVFYMGDFSVSGYQLGTLFTHLLGVPDVSAAKTRFAILARLSVIDWHPWVAVYLASEANPDYNVIYDIDNYSLISKVALRRIHEACTMSLFKLDLQPAGSNM